MKFKRIYTKRNIESWPSWQIVYEWEDFFEKEFNVKLKGFSRTYNYIIQNILSNKIVRIINYLLSIFQTQRYDLAFLMNINEAKYFAGRRNFIPIIIDIWPKDIDDFVCMFRQSEFVYVNSYEIYDILKKTQLKNSIKYMPYTISDKWYSEKNAMNKTIDIIQIGRKNCVLHEYALKLCEKHPHIEYVYQKQIDNELHYYSTKSKDIGVFNDRKDYMSLLQKAKISLVSSSGMDNSRDTGGVNPVTTRFYESAINYCHMVGRYPDNTDFKLNKVSDVCSKTNSIEDFEVNILLKLAEDNVILINKYRTFIKEHLTSKIIDNEFKVRKGDEYNE